MDELRESSLLFSLEGLLETERERVQREAREAQKRRDDELARVAEAAERRRAAALREREARERRQAIEDERERLEQEQLEALTRATVERARIEAESAMRLVEAEQARKHDLAIARIREAERTTRYRTLTWLSIGAFSAAVIGGLVAYFGLIQPAHARAQQHLQGIIGANAEHAKATELALATEQRRNRALNARLEELLSRPSEAPPPNDAKPSTSLVKPAPVRPPPAKRNGACKDTGDPLDNCLR